MMRMNQMMQMFGIATLLLLLLLLGACHKDSNQTAVNPEQPLAGDDEHHIYCCESVKGAKGSKCELAISTDACLQRSHLVCDPKKGYSCDATGSCNCDPAGK